MKRIPKMMKAKPAKWADKNGRVITCEAGDTIKVVIDSQQEGGGFIFSLEENGGYKLFGNDDVFSRLTIFRGGRAFRLNPYRALELVEG